MKYENRIEFVKTQKTKQAYILKLFFVIYALTCSVKCFICSLLLCTS